VDATPPSSPPPFLLSLPLSVVGNETKEWDSDPNVTVTVGPSFPFSFFLPFSPGAADADRPNKDCLCNGTDDKPRQ